MNGPSANSGNQKSSGTQRNSKNSNFFLGQCHYCGKQGHSYRACLKEKKAGQKHEKANFSAKESLHEDDESQSSDSESSCS